MYKLLLCSIGLFSLSFPCVMAAEANEPVSSIIYPDEMARSAEEINASYKSKNPSTYDIGNLKVANYPTPVVTSIPFMGEFLSSNNIYELSPNRLPVKDVSEIFKDEHNLKEHIAFADMSDLVVLKAGAAKTSIVTIHVLPCVAIVAINTATKNIGLAHIPGGPVDDPLERGHIKNYDPLTHDYSLTNYKRMNTASLKTGLTDFLYEVADGHNEATEIYLIGGYSNRYLVLTLVNLIGQLGYGINIKNILYSKNSRASVFDDTRGGLFNIEVNKDGVFLLNDVGIIRNNRCYSIFQLKSMLFSLPESIQILNDHLTNSVSIRQKRIDQFENLTLTVYGQDAVNKYIYDPTFGVIDINRIKNDSEIRDAAIRDAAKDKFTLLAQLLNYGLDDETLARILQNAVVVGKNQTSVEMCLNSGANPNIPNAFGISALDSARIMRNQKLENLMSKRVK